MMKLEKFKIEDYDLFILDMDGTIYFEDELIAGAKEFIDYLKENNKFYVFVSNNSSVNKDIYFERLARLNIQCDKKNLFSASMAMGLYLQKNYKGKKVYAVGTKAFEEELMNYGVVVVNDAPDIVVVGYDSELTYDKLVNACSFLDNGALFLAANPDLVFPLKNKRYLPDCGSICKMITNATGKEPLYIGKPSAHIVDLLGKEFGVEKDKIVVIGDRLYTDIQLGINSNIDSVLVLSGETDKSMLNDSTIKPTFVASSIKELKR